MEITQRIRLLLSEMNRGVYEKETEINLSLLAALAGESILLLGPPGVAKSMVARRSVPALPAQELAAALWAALDEDNRVSLYVAAAGEEVIINKHGEEA